MLGPKCDFTTPRTLLAFRTDTVNCRSSWQEASVRARHWASRACTETGWRGSLILTWHRLSPSGRAKIPGCLCEDAQRGSSCLWRAIGHQPRLPPTGHTARTGRKRRLCLSIARAAGSFCNLLTKAKTFFGTWFPWPNNKLNPEQ